MPALRKVGWVAAVLVGVGLVGVGIAFIALGVDAKDRLRTAVVRGGHLHERGCGRFPMRWSPDVETAEAQEALLTEHTLGRYGPLQLHGA